MTISKPLVALSFPTRERFEENLSHLIRLIRQTPENAIVIAPEVALSGFAYERFDEAADFTESALDALLHEVGNRLLIFTAITRREEGMFNTAYALHNGKILHAQSKSKLFALGNEHHYFSEASEAEIVPFEFEGITIGILICFELRFKALWQRLEGCDLIAVSAQWGRGRSEHFDLLTKALAVMNQCYVSASDAANEETTGHSCIVTPFGAELRNHASEMAASHYERRTIDSMRRYLNVGIA